MASCYLLAEHEHWVEVSSDSSSTSETGVSICRAVRGHSQECTELEVEEA